MTLTRPDLSYQVAEALVALRFQALPAATVASARRLVLDSLAVALAGHGCSDVGAVLRLALQWGGRPESAVIGAQARVPAPAAALVNGTMIQALDFDETHDPSGAHIASTVLAAALAVADLRGKSGADLLTALVAGVELAGRLGLACTDKIGWTSTAVYGAFGATAAAAHLLGLNARETRHALGIVISQTAGTTQTAIDSPLSKHMQSGFAAKAGVLSALLAAQGVSGVEGVFEGQFGFFKLYKAGRYCIDPLMEPWRAPFEVDKLSYKLFPSCRATHGPVEASLALRASGSFKAEDIASVDVALPQMGWSLTGKPFVEGDNPMIAAQFSATYCVATALLEGQLALRHFTLDAIRNPAVRRLADRVKVRAEHSADFFTPARVSIATADGRSFSHTIKQLKGAPDLPMTDAELLEKIEDCLAFAPRGAARISGKELWRRVQGLHEIPAGEGLLAGISNQLQEEEKV